MFKDKKLDDSRPGDILYRKRTPIYEDVEKYILSYLELRNRHFNATKIGLSFAFLKQKAKLYWDNLPEAQKAGRDFKASTGWLCGVLKNNHFSSHIIHGEGGEVSDANKQ